MQTNKNVRRMKTEAHTVTKDATTWIAATHLHQMSLKGPISFVIHFKSRTGIVGNAVTKTTDGSSVTVTMFKKKKMKVDKIMKERRKNQIESTKVLYMREGENKSKPMPKSKSISKRNNDNNRQRQISKSFEKVRRQDYDAYINRLTDLTLEDLQQ